jgi:hypothetical protein
MTVHISDHEIMQKVAEADEWLAMHRISPAWRVISDLRDTVVRMQTTKGENQ